MYYVYILKSKADKNFYVGCTQDLKKRLTMHNTGKIESTRSRQPLHLIFYEAFLNKSDAFQREQWLKTGWGRNQLRTMLENYLKSLGG